MTILDFLFPKRCVGCGRFGKYICSQCRAMIRVVAFNESLCPICEKPAIGGATHPRCRSRYGLDGLTSFFHYDGPVRKAVQVIKYRFVYDMARELVLLAPPVALPDGVLVPIPLHPTRFRYRGFNQAEKLCRFLRIPVRTDILRRQRQTNPQVEIGSREKRLKNMTGAFMASRPPKHIILFDDVFTTGATMRAAASALKRAGAKFVWAVTMAR